MALAVLDRLAAVASARPAVRIFAALSPANPATVAILRELDYPWVLAAFKATMDPRDLPYRPGLMLDSGAFAVWNSGKTIDIYDYIGYAKSIQATYGRRVDVINLDVIPGTPDTVPTATQRQFAIGASAENAEIIRSAGLRVIEVYHRFEPPEVLDAILERRRPGEVICFGGLVGRSGGTAAKVEWAGEAFARLRDLCGGWDRLAPVHGLGVSGDSPLGRRFPWWSVDSTGWATARNFNLHVTRKGRYKPRDRVTAPRTTPDMVAVFVRRRLDRWRRDEESLTRTWERRGVRYAP